MQEQTGMYGAIVIDPIDAGKKLADREHVILFSDWMDENPMSVLSKLKNKGYLQSEPCDGWGFCPRRTQRWREGGHG
jgi:FtsP/CotA-like multicopper oxidase with cupredoxin domain